MNVFSTIKRKNRQSYDAMQTQGTNLKNMIKFDKYLSICSRKTYFRDRLTFENWPLGLIIRLRSNKPDELLGLS